MQNTQEASKEFLKFRKHSGSSPRPEDEVYTTFARCVAPGFPEVTGDGRVLDRSREIYERLGEIYGDQLDEESYHFDRESATRASLHIETNGNTKTSTTPLTSTPPTRAGPSSAANDNYSSDLHASSASVLIQPTAGPSRLGNAANGSSGPAIPYCRPLRRENAVVSDHEASPRQSKPLKREGAVYITPEMSLPIQPTAGPSRLGNAVNGSSGPAVPHGRPLRRENAVIIDRETGTRQPKPLKREGAVYIGPDFTVETSPVSNGSRFSAPGSPLDVYSERNQRFSATPNLNAESLEADRKLRNNAMATTGSLQLAPFAREAAPSPDVYSDISSSPLTPLSSDYPSPAPSPALTGSGKGKKRARDEDEVDNANGSGNQPIASDAGPRPTRKAKRTHTKDTTTDRKGKKRAREEDEVDEAQAADADSQGSPSKRMKPCTIVIPPRTVSTPKREVMSISHLCGIEAGPSGLAGAGSTATLAQAFPAAAPGVAVPVAITRPAGDCIARRTRSAFPRAAAPAATDNSGGSGSASQAPQATAVRATRETKSRKKADNKKKDDSKANGKGEGRSKATGKGKGKRSKTE
ncbi:hypothetical protein EST38_g5026 [Candolleomyces aberdarensis]|uniref:Uncharacterized protein n=1 Tax=Candolleomyces aberdarensis TaxID=2316362 RepID=A0A4Q2DPS3_9AGAR|nr:hypothetical protein EST38_g5026 [Candolleomyces aberdarensis]